LTGNGPDQRAAAATLQRSLVFQDQKDGGVRVEDGVTGETLTVLHGEQGFVRGALRALSRERYSRGIGSSAPFDVIARVDGRVTLFDPSTGQRVDLESFGPTNTAEFTRFLAMRPE
jgi:putative photosynthetic complex assembly protein